MDIDKDKIDELFIIVETIINSHQVRGQVQYWVRWQDFEEKLDI